MPEYLAIYDYSREDTSTGGRYRSEVREQFIAGNRKQAIRKAEDLGVDLGNRAIKRGFAKLQHLYQVREIPLEQN